MAYHSQIEFMRRLAAVYRLFTTSTGKFDNDAFNDEFISVRSRSLQFYELGKLDTPNGKDLFQQTVERVFWHRCFVRKEYGEFTGNPGPFPVFHPPVEVCIPHTSPVKAAVDGYPDPASSNIILARPTLLPRSRLPRASITTAPNSSLQESHTRLGSLADIANANFHAPRPSDYQNHETYSRARRSPQQTPRTADTATLNTGSTKATNKQENLSSYFSKTLNLNAEASYPPRSGTRHRAVLKKSDLGVCVEAQFPSFTFKYSQAPHKPFAFDLDLLGDAKKASENGVIVLTPPVLREIEDAHQMLQKYTGLPSHALPNLADVVRERGLQ